MRTWLDDVLSDLSSTEPLVETTTDDMAGTQTHANASTNDRTEYPHKLRNQRWHALNEGLRVTSTIYGRERTDATKEGLEGRRAGGQEEVRATAGDETKTRNVPLASQAPGRLAGWLVGARGMA